MLESVHIHDFGCVRDASLKLTPLHALIGPNDSGKSTVLRAIQAFAAAWIGDEREIPGNASVEGVVAGSAVLFSRGESWLSHASGGKESGDPTRLRASPLFKALESKLGRAATVRFDADSLRKPSQLVPDSAALEFLSSRGEGLPGIYQAIQSRSDESFSKIKDGLRKLFPAVNNLRVPALSPSELTLEVVLNDSAKTRVPASHMSEGLLYYLGFAALPHIAPISILLVEEPENGLHPARIREIVQLLRSLTSEVTQVVMATHSPLVINELAPEEVSIVTRERSVGTRITPMQATPNFAARSKVYALGELWLSYADGMLESELTGR